MLKEEKEQTIETHYNLNQVYDNGWNTTPYITLQAHSNPLLKLELMKFLQRGYIWKALLKLKRK